jgi:hypothetical protein
VGVERLGRDVGVVGPDDRVALGVGAELREVGWVAERLEHTAIVDQVCQVYIGNGAVLEPKMNTEPL